MKKLIVAAFILAGVSFAGNAQTSAMTAVNHSASPLVVKHPIKAATKTSTVPVKGVTAPATGKTVAATTEKKNVVKKTSAKTTNPANKSSISHKKHKAHKAAKKNKNQAKQ